MTFLVVISFLFTNLSRFLKEALIFKMANAETIPPSESQDNFQVHIL